MDFDTTDRERDIRGLARAALADPDVRTALTELHASPAGDVDVRPLYRALGRSGVLSVGWPVEYGGRGASHTEAAVMVEELVRAGVPDMANAQSHQTVGLLLQMAGSDHQKASYLPRLARGEIFATMLYTEPGAESDLASLPSTAARDGDGYVLNGTKLYGLPSGIADVALCAVHTGSDAGNDKGISLMLIDMHAEGVCHTSPPKIADEQFDRVVLDGVRVEADALVGAEGDGWALLNRCPPIDRTGLECALRAERWFDATIAGLDGSDVDDALMAEVGRYGAAVSIGRLLSWDVLGHIDRGEMNDLVAASSTYHGSKAAQEIAVWATQVHGADYRLRDLAPDDARLLEAAYRECPGITIAAGTAQTLFSIVAASTLSAVPGQEAGTWT